MPIIVSSALTFLDTTDQNQLSAYLTSNFATVQTCTSDKSVYSPSWKDDNLELQLHALYDGKDMSADKLEGKVTWFYKDGNKDEVQIADNDYYTISAWTKLIVKDNVIKDCDSDTITFICKVKLNDVDTMTVQMTYTLISDTKAVSFYLGMPDGDTFTNQTGTREIIAYAYRGVDEIKAGNNGTIDSDTATFVWYKYNTKGEWEVDTDDVDDNDPKKLTIQGTSVINIASFKCVMTYKGVEYIGVATVRDITDTYISEIFTIGGDVFKNGIGGSAAYVIVRKNGQADEEVDQLKGEISETAGAASSGDYWYQIDHKNDKIIYNQYATKWQTVSEIPQDLVYTWTLMDKNGNAKPFKDKSYEKTGKVIYVSCDDIDDTGTVQCVVSAKE
jgi:hypothetical protein